MISYANGTYVPTNELALPLADDTIGTIRGYRIFTACRTIGDKVFRLEDHVERLYDSAEKLHMELPHTREELTEQITEVVEKNKDEAGDLLVEIIYSGGKASSNGVTPAGKADTYIVVFPLKLPDDDWYTKGIALASFPYQRQWPEVKLLHYVGAVIAHQTVVKEHKAEEALFISPDEHKVILEGTTFNFYIVKQHKIFTYPLDGKILSGITRKVTLQLAGDIGIEVEEKAFPYTELGTADEAFLTSSTRNVVPVVRVDSIQIGDGTPGPVVRQLREKFKDYLANY